MPSSKISELSAATSSQIKSDDLLTFVDVSEQDVEKINKSITTENFAGYLRDFTNIFPIPFTSQFITPDAYINGVQTPIASKVGGQTVNLGDVGAFKFDEYGRVYDYTTNSENVASEEILMAAGTAALWYKTKITDNFDTAQPSSLNSLNDVGVGDETAGYFNANSYWNPANGNSTYNTSQKINYSDRQENDYDWTYYFSKTYGRFKKSIIEMEQGGGQDLGIYGNTSIYIEIDWENAKVVATGILAARSNYNGSFIMNANLTNGVNTIKGDIQNASELQTGIPQLIIDYPNRKILGLPLSSVIRRNKYINSGAQISLKQTNII